MDPYPPPLPIVPTPDAYPGPDNPGTWVHITGSVGPNSIDLASFTANTDLLDTAMLFIAAIAVVTAVTLAGYIIIQAKRREYEQNQDSGTPRERRVD